jgi:CRISPR-associated protein Cas1
MKKHLNTLFVTTQGAYLAKEAETVTVRVEKKVRLRLPVHTLDGVVCFGNVGCSPFLLGFCAERDVTISFLTEYGRFLARVQGPVSGNVLLRREQYRRADDPAFSALMARAFINGKIANCRALLNRAVRDHPEKMDTDAVSNAANHLTGLLKSLGRDLPLDEVRGTEGDGAHVYFSAFDHLIIRHKKDFFFHRRSRRPPLDLVNCLLSFLYTLVMHDVRSALECTGLDPAVGFLHRDRPGRASLALDMMEEFRPMADRMALSLINRGQLQAKDFVVSDSGGVRMKDKARKVLLTAYQERKQDVLMHPFLEEKMPLGLFFHTQSLLLARFLRGDLDGYPPMIQR